MKNKNKDIIIDNKQKLYELEQEYSNFQIKDIQTYIDEKKETISNEIIKYAETHMEATKYDREGNPIEYKPKLSPLVITNYFFKPLISLTSKEPVYSAEQLGIMFDYYCYLILEINDKIGFYPSSLTSFCKLCSITLNTLRTFKNSPDYSMRVVAEKIYDQIGDENVTMSQMGIVKERSTIFKMKSQNEIVEKAQPNININITEKPDMEQINARLEKYKSYAKKGK